MLNFWCITQPVGFKRLINVQRKLSDAIIFLFCTLEVLDLEISFKTLARKWTNTHYLDRFFYAFPSLPRQKTVSYRSEIGPLESLLSHPFPFIIYCNIIIRLQPTWVSKSIVKTLKTKNSENISYKMRPDFRKGKFPWKVPGSHSLILLVRATQRRLEDWWWQGTTKVLGEKPITMPLRPPQITHVLTWAFCGG